MHKKFADFFESDSSRKEVKGIEVASTKIEVSRTFFSVFLTTECTFVQQNIYMENATSVSMPPCSLSTPKDLNSGFSIFLKEKHWRNKISAKYYLKISAMPCSAP